MIKNRNENGRFVKGHSKLGGFSFYKGYVPSLETREKISKASKGRIFSEETRKKLSEALKGKTFSSQRKKRISESLKDRKLTAETKQKIRIAMLGRETPWLNGRKLSQETIRKRTKTLQRNAELRGYWFTPEHKKKISEALKGKSHKRGQSEEHKKKISQALKGRRKYFTEEHIRNILKASQIKPNKLELELDSILNEVLPREYSLNVNGEILILDRKVPDFVNINGKKKLIEFFGRHWHKQIDEIERRKAFKSFGWQTLVIWEEELKNVNNLRKKIKEFNNG